MKAATHTSKCQAGTPRSHAGSVRRGAHLAKRRPAASGPVAADAPRLTITLLDGPHSTRAIDGDLNSAVPHVLLIDRDIDTAIALSSLLMPEAHLVHASTAAEARRLLDSHIFSLVIVDPYLGDAGSATVLPTLMATPVLVYAERQPERMEKVLFLPKPWTTPRQLWSTISALLGIGGGLSAGD